MNVIFHRRNKAKENALCVGCDMMVAVAVDDLEIPK